MVIAGGLLSLVVIVRWIAGARRDIDELPLHQTTSRRIPRRVAPDAAAPWPP